MKSFLAMAVAVLSIAAVKGKTIASGLFPLVLTIEVDTHVTGLVNGAVLRGCVSFSL